MVWGVAALLSALSDAMAARFGAVTVEGEISGFTRAASGHCYFSLKDADGRPGLLRCALFRRTAAMLDFSPQDGQRVQLRGRMAIYEPRGELQFVAEAMRRSGEGALYEQFLRLKAALEAQGLFDPAGKKPLPRFPRRLGIVTSTAAAALRDVLTALARRAPQVEVVIYPSPVQGADAPDALVRALALANERREVDVLLLVRGGGSLEDLWAFNDERVVRAVAQSELPLICGVGHETDLTLADLAADLRAPTPTAAAELAISPREALLEQLLALEARLARRLGQRLDVMAQTLDRLALRLARPGDALARQRRRLDLLGQRWGQVLPQRLRLQSQRLGHLEFRLAMLLPQALAARQQRLQHLRERWQRSAPLLCERQRLRLDALGQRLEALDPQRVLARGYAWLDDGRGQALVSVRQLAPGQALGAVLADGRAALRVEGVEPADPQP